ncbi:MAG: lysophospholipid acyltransferase family protein [Gammaproteobacteria bacterium]|nr:lysophospholipid acyltransferase family protein [Gammaproteobacteria bacterium]
MRDRLAKLALVFFARLPLRTAYNLGTVLAYLSYLFPSKLKHVVKTNISLCFPDFTPEYQARLSRQCWIEMHKSITESGPLWTGDKNTLLNLAPKISGEVLITEALSKGRGVLLAAPHLGAWEMVGAYCSIRYPMTSLYRPARFKKLDQYIRTARQRFGATLVPTNSQGIRTLLRALKNNEMAAILPDQDPGREGNVFAPFFGTKASTMTLLARLARKSGATIVFAYAERLPKPYGFHIHFLPAPENINSADLVLAATQLNRSIEYCIRQLPAQYIWSYKRFKTRPPGEKKIY